MPPSSERPQHSFLVKVWYEPDQANPGQWRGSVEHVLTGQRMYFVSFTDLNDFISFHMHQEPEPPALFPPQPNR